jgi:hypothetical protein
VSGPFKPGDKVIWFKRVAGEFVFPFRAKVLAVTAKRIKILAEDVDDGDSGPVVRHVARESLQFQSEGSPAENRGISQRRRHRE